MSIDFKHERHLFNKRTKEKRGKKLIKEMVKKKSAVIKVCKNQKLEKFVRPAG